jgi:hypothetical protein
MIEYKVEHLLDSSWKVTELESVDGEMKRVTLHQGSLSDC